MTLPPVQKLTGPLAEIVGTGVTETETEDEFGDVHPLLSVVFTKYVPCVPTVIDPVVDPSDQRLPPELLDVKVTLSPAHKFVEPPAEITGAAGKLFTLT